MTPRRILVLSTLGSGSSEEARIRELMAAFAPDVFRFDRTKKARMFWRLLRTIRRTRPDVVVLEGTGVAGGFALIAARVLFGRRYVVSSGDAVGPWVGSQVRWLGPAFGLYERALCRFASGFIGWTPYLAGRALTFGCPRAMTAAGWAPFTRTQEEQAADRVITRTRLGIPPGQLVVGIAGSMVWTRRFGYCYGAELVETARRVARSDVTFLLIGDGSGLAKLEARATGLPAGRVVFTGRVPQEELPKYYAAMDVGSLPQSVDQVGSFRYTTKLSEYLAFGLPVVTGCVPLAYDLDQGWLWRLPGRAPWVAEYAQSFAQLLDGLSAEQLSAKRAAVPVAPPEFDRATQVARATAFVRELAIRKTSPAVVREDVAESLPLRPVSRPFLASVPGRPRRLLSIGHSYAVGMNRRLVHEMARIGGQKWEVTAVAPSYFHGQGDLRPQRFESLPGETIRVEVVPTHFSQYVHVFSYSQRLKQVLAQQWDCVHAWEEPYIWAGGQIARWTSKRVPLVYRTAQNVAKWYPPPFNLIEKFDMERAAGWICSGELVAQTLGARHIYARRPMRLVPLGVDANAFAPNRAAGEHVLRKLNWERSGPPVVGYLGRFSNAKGLALLMNVLGDLDTPWRALFVGAGPLEGQLRAWAARFGDRVRVCTDVGHAQVPAYLNAMDVLAAPSQTTPHWREQFGRMLIEAFASGVPVIGSDSGEIPYVIKSTGVVVAERDELAWTHAMRALLNSPSQRRDLADAASARVHSEFAWPVIAKRYLEFFEELL
ncbi:MAG: glycosyltransferase [Vicinamibacterales bacterium]